MSRKLRVLASGQTVPLTTVLGSRYTENELSLRYDEESQIISQQNGPSLDLPARFPINIAQELNGGSEKVRAGCAELSSGGVERPVQDVRAVFPWPGWRGGMGVGRSRSL